MGSSNETKQPTQQEPPKGKKASPADAINAFFDIVQDHVASMTATGRQSDAWRGPNAEQYSEELSLLQPHFTPILWGVGCSVLSFAAFRLSGAVRISRSSSSAGGYTFSRLPSPLDARGRGGGGGGGAANEAEAKSRLLGRMLSIPVDIALSFLIGCSATIFLAETDKLQKDVSTIPLVKGRSLVADELCVDFTREYQIWPRSMWDNSKMTEETHPSLGAIQSFVENCKRRREVEAKIRSENGLGDEEPVLIPEQISRLGHDADKEEATNESMTYE